jgi:hypothetical protein
LRISQVYRKPSGISPGGFLLRAIWLELNMAKKRGELVRKPQQFIQ